MEGRGLERRGLGAGSVWGRGLEGRGGSWLETRALEGRGKQKGGALVKGWDLEGRSGWVWPGWRDGA